MTATEGKAIDLMAALKESLAGQSLRERARIAAETARVERERDEAERAAADFAMRQSDLVNRMADVLGHTITAEQVDLAHPFGVVTVTLAGLTFGIKDHGSEEWTREELSVGRVCSRGCGHPVWVSIECDGDVNASIALLGDTIADTTAKHHYGCANPTASLSQRERADAAVKSVVDAATACGNAHALIMALEDERPLIKAKCIEQMIGTPNPLGKPGAVHSASSAEAVVEQNKLYWDHRQKQAAAEVEKWKALGTYEAAKRAADLAVETYRSLERAS